MNETSRIVITREPVQEIRSLLSGKAYSRVAVLVDDNTAAFCYPIIAEAVEDPVLITVTAGEAHKNIETCTRIWRTLTHNRFDRHSLLIILGGGVLGDMGGFCAATYKRGIDFVLVPTTLLAQVDASIGGKLGVDFDGFKNQIGVFREPVATIVAPVFLNTLPEAELRSGFAEVIKHCLSADEKQWNQVRKKDLAGQDWPDLIAHSIRFKSAIIRQDPYETGPRKVLNAGHTIGHAVETCFLKASKPIMHGEAIAIGLISESYISNRLGLLPAAALEEITSYLKRIFPKKNLPGIEEIMPIVMQDKKNRQNRVLMALIERIGRVNWDVEVSEKEIAASIEYYHSL